MSRLFISVSFLILGFAGTIICIEKANKKVHLSIADPDAVNIQSAVIVNLPYSNILTNYSNIGLSDQAGAINCLVVDRTDSNLILAGSQNGGVWISHNNAHSWMPVNDTARSLCVTSIAQNNFRANEFYYSTGVDIRENGVLLYDIYRSVDFGQTFSIVTPASNQSFGKVTKIIPSPVDANTMYFLHNSPNHTDGAVYRTTDNCNTFQKVYQSSNYMIDDMVLLPDGTVEIGYKHSVWRSNSGNLNTFVQATGIDTTGYDTHIAFCESRPDIQYCTVFLYGGYDFYKSIDTGRTWNFISTQPSMMFGRRIAVKPDDPDFVFSANMGPSVSVDGGQNWQYASGGHDHRSYNFDPHRPGKVYVTSDFGICTLEVDPVTSSSFNVEYRADSLLYSQEAYHGDHAATGIQTLQGYQDLGCRFISNNMQDNVLMAGDGTWACISKQNPDIGYYCDHDGDLFRSDHMTTNTSYTSILNQLDADHNGNVDDGTMFINPFVMNNANDSQLYFPTFQRLWRSLDRGANWYQVSGTHSNQMADLSIACNHKPNPIVYWTNSDSVFVLANAATAAPYSEFGKTVPYDPGRCYADPNHDSALYVLSRFLPYHISYCQNLFTSNTWQDIPLTQLSGLTIQCMAVYPGNDQVIFVGTKEGGIYVTLDRGISWTKELGMPNVQITEIKIRETDKKVFIFTYGRGTWTADFTIPLSVTTNKVTTVSVYPNPFRDHLTIEFEKNLNTIVEVSDMQGKLCLRKSVSGKEIKMSTEDLVSGFYVISVFEGKEMIYQGKGIRVKE